MKLERLKKLLGSQVSVKSSEIKGLAYDSRSVKVGFVFFALPGASSDGHDYINDAIDAGAIAIVSERDIDCGLPVFVVLSSKKALALASHHFYHESSNKIKMVGVTGTNGKTTVTHLIHHVYELLEVKSGLIGTNRYVVPDAPKVTNTTPISHDLNAMLASSFDSGIRHVIMEVSSHGIKENRVDHIDFDAFVFTNLTEDHLDYHPNFDDYMWTKMRPFIALAARADAIINIDDAHGRYFCDVTKAKITTFGLSIHADFRAINIIQQIDSTTFDLFYKNQFVANVETNMFGTYNVYNVLATIAYFYTEGYQPKRLAKLFAQLPQTSGRFETFKTTTGIYVVVDYAHTPDAIRHVLKSLSTVAPRSVLTVVGAGGDRDASKRAGMGKYALAHSTHVVFTSDNPRSEDPQAIIYDMLKGSVKTNYSICIDRERAIEKALKMAKPKDVVILLGKGHEQTQTIKGETRAFCDKKVAHYWVEKLGI